MRSVLLPALALLLATSAAEAAQPATSSYGSSPYGSPSYSSTPYSSPPAAAPASTGMPDLISFGVGWTGFDKKQANTHASDYRLEYRFGYTFLGGDEIGFHPFLAYEQTSRDLIYGLGGFAMDWNFLDHGIFTWSEGAGYLDSGDQRSLGGTFQFRSQAELGYRFDNNMRLTGEFSHISDAKLTRVNPGAEVIGVYLHVPTMMIFGATR